MLLETFLFDKNRARHTEEVSEAEGELQTVPKPTINCALCNAEITTEEERLSIEGKYNHVFTNPHGYVFDIGCFNRAPGCINAGMPTEEFTWFSGYAWRYALCHRCHCHLGWFFTAVREDSFYGLILRRLIFPG